MPLVQVQPGLGWSATSSSQRICGSSPQLQARLVGEGPTDTGLDGSHIFQALRSFPSGIPAPSAQPSPVAKETEGFLVMAKPGFHGRQALEL